MSLPSPYHRVFTVLVDGVLAGRVLAEHPAQAWELWGDRPRGRMVEEDFGASLLVSRRLGLTLQRPVYDWAIDRRIGGLAL